MLDNGQMRTIAAAEQNRALVDHWFREQSMGNPIWLHVIEQIVLTDDEEAAIDMLRKAPGAWRQIRVAAQLALQEAYCRVAINTQREAEADRGDE